MDRQSKPVRTVSFEYGEICYHLERKPVKNLNLRIYKDGSVSVSANRKVPVSQIDSFVISKGRFIFSAQKKFAEMAQYAPQPKQYVSGETFYLQGRELRLNLEKSAADVISSDGRYLFLRVTDPCDFAKKQKLITKYFDEQCNIVFSQIMLEFYPIFQKYGVAMPELRIRNMKTRWGSCLVKKGIITLNKRLLETPHICIEYVIMHEFCHLIHPNHSKYFYDFLSMQMPDWKERKKTLDNCKVYL